MFRRSVETRKTMFRTRQEWFILSKNFILDDYKNGAALLQKQDRLTSSLHIVIYQRCKSNLQKTHFQSSSSTIFLNPLPQSPSSITTLLNILFLPRSLTPSTSRLATPPMAKSTSKCQKRKKSPPPEVSEPAPRHVEKIVRGTVHHCGGERAGGKGSCHQRNGFCIRHQTYCNTCKRMYMTHQQCMCKPREEKSALTEKRGK